MIAAELTPVPQLIGECQGAWALNGQGVHRPPVFFQADLVAFGDFGETGDVGVVFEVGQFDAAADGVGFGAEDELFVGFGIAAGDGVDTGDYFFGKAFGAEAIERPAAIFDDVVESGGHAFFRRGEAEHDAEDVKDIRGAGLIDLSFVGDGGEGDGAFQGTHATECITAGV